MRKLFIISIILFFYNCALAQVAVDSVFHNWQIQSDTTSHHFKLLDGQIKLNQRNTLDMSNSNFNPTNANIESNGYRDTDGTLYTMRIKVPRDNHAALRTFQWSPRLDSIDPKIIYPPVIKE